MPLLGAGQRHPDLVEPAGIRPGEQDPADRAEIGRDDEGAEHHQPDEALRRHVGARDRPGERHAEQAGQHRDAGAEHAACSTAPAGGARGRRPRHSSASVSRPVSGSWKLETTSRTIGLAIRNTSTAISAIHRIMLGSSEAQPARDRAFGRLREVVDRGGHADRLRRPRDPPCAEAATGRAGSARSGRTADQRLTRPAARPLDSRLRGNERKERRSARITRRTCRATA